MLYQELLDFSKERLDKFFANVQIFENQFTWSDFNQQCYESMYSNNTYDNIATVKDMKTSIIGLKETCKACGAFYMPARNKSIPKYDVILGKQHEELLMEFLSLKLGAKTDRADLSNRSLPDCKLVRADGTTAAYFEVKFHGAPFIMAFQKTRRFCYEGSATLDSKKIKKQLSLIDDGLDAPVYYVHWIEYPCLKGIFYETSEQVKSYFLECHEEFERQHRDGDDLKSKEGVYLGKKYSPLLKMENFESLLKEFERLLIG